MKIFKGTDFNQVYYEMLLFADSYEGDYKESRVGEVKDLGPAYFEISEDNFRLIYLKNRDFNPFFALTEFSWILKGSNQLEPLQYYIRNYNKYSDDKKTLNGAYGFRLRHYFDSDQIEIAINQLKNKSTTRRVVLTMWSIDDLNSESNDLPCNISLLLKIREGKLDLTVINRSNDIFLGVPYNVFVFHLLQRYLAEEIGCEIGNQRHFTDSLHLYKRDIAKVKSIINNNSVQTIKNTRLLLNSFDIYKYINENHNAVLNRKFNEIKDKDIRSLFVIYEKYRKEEDINSLIDMLPKNILGYIAFQWLRKFGQTALNESYFSKIDEQIFLDEYTFDFDELKYKEKAIIKTHIDKFVNKYKANYNQFANIISSSNKLFILNSNIDEEKVLSNVFISLILCDVYNVYSPEIRKSIMGKLTELCGELDINIDEVNQLTGYESGFQEIISKKSN